VLLGPGDRLGRYQIVRSIGVGGMAELYVARAKGIEGFEKLVALKRILPELARDSEFIDMFLDEARLAAGLTHPNVVSVYDIGSDDNGYFFAMEYLRGEDVSALLKTAARQGRTMSLGHALAIVTGAAAGLHHAHEACDENGEPLGIVHRDVSPTNIIVTREGGVKVVDFGIAKALSRRSKTVTGRIKGKVAYLSPEQCRGEPLDRRSDVFALGIVLFELTTGTRMFGKMDDFAIMHRIASGELDAPSVRRDDYPAELERIVQKALERDPAARYASARELMIDLEAFARELKLDLSANALAELMRGIQDSSDTTPLSRTLPTRVAESTTASLSASLPGVPKHSSAPWLVALLAIAGAGAFMWWMREPAHPATIEPAMAPPVPIIQEEPRVEPSAPPPASFAPIVSSAPAPRRPPPPRPMPSAQPKTHDGLL